MSTTSETALNGFRLSPAQQRHCMLVDAGRAPAAQRVTARFVWTAAPPRREAVDAALNALIGRHEILRACFPRLPEMRLPLQTASGDARLRLDAGAAPDAGASPLQASMDAQGLTLSLPALCADGPTMLRLGALLAALLDGVDADGDAPLQFFDLAQWQHDLLAEDGAWRWPAGTLQSVDGPWPALPALRGGGAAPYRHARHACPLPADTGARVRTICARVGVMPADLLTAVWAVLLRRLSGGDAQPVAIVADGRPFDELATALGPLAAPVPLALSAALSAHDGTFATLAKAAADARLKAADLRHHLAPPDDAHFAPFQIEVLTAGMPDDAPLRVVDVTTAGEPALLKLTVLVARDGALRADLDHHADAVRDDGAMTRLAEQFATLLGAVLANPDARYDEPDLLGAAERRLVTADFQGARVEHGRWTPVHLAVAATAAALPDRLAVQDGRVRVTAAALERSVRALAARLAAAGVAAETPVVLHLPRGLALVTAMLAVLRAGGAYLPMPPELPAERRRYMLEDSRARIVLTRPDAADGLPKDLALECIDPDAPDGADADAAAGALPIPGPKQAAYILYTSGSTGRPKGVVVTHGSLANHMAWMTRAFPLDADDAVLQKTAAGFDASVWEFFLPLMRGARLVMAPPGLERDVPALVETLARARITVLQLVPSLLRVLVDQPGFAACGGLRRVFCGGEALTPELARRFAAVHRAALVNLYGPTETTIQICAERVDPADDPVPVGRPIDNVRLYVVDPRGRPVPVGMRGEILIGGAAPARGYLHRPELSAERFVADPVDPLAPRVYRSGDQGAWRPDGRLEFFGRADDQVKLRGYRVELGEVEVTIARHPDVANAAARIDLDANGIARLVCAYDCRAGRNVAPAQLRDWLATQLPDYMIPGQCRRLDALPLNASGKIDRAALAGCADASPEGGAPRDPVELRLERVWEGVLDVQPIGVDRTFFDLGGHSLLAVRLMAEIKREFGCDLPLASLFEAPTVAAQAALVRQRAPSDPVVVRVNRGIEGERPVFLVHPTGGNVLCYRDLARRLGPARPVYALQDPGLEGVADYDSVEELAALHIAHIRPLAGDGPYYLAGWSSGGVVAFEMARQLLAQREEVGLLALIDSIAATDADTGPRTDAALIQSIARLLAFTAGADTPDLASLDTAAALERLRELAVAAGSLPPDAPPERIRRLFDVFRRNTAAVRRYRPGPYPRRVLLLRATQPLPEAVRDAAARQRSDSPDLGWARVAAVSCRDIPAHHLSIVGEPAAALVGAEIRHALQAADRIEAIGEQVFFTLLGH
ncbi:non-ribosomal peptide synthetase [Burkholderia ubonensis]|uniref:Non-ribosomal peptide synthetase n=1 Tax=Burkholderia ubonensis subsp. mesacidophila TaxID=265293 RepID=A0A2A4FCI0_9BURK|nr:non-ribosomal peptide synthetase [Burkholderia ubonensis]PCE30707.1 non-ribosomal peptide synthetase [Burkholderia ubonensis subsp. mesacidophila]